MTDTTNPQQAERRDRYAAAIRETDGWVLDDGQHMLDAVMAVADAEQAELRRERDLAIAHDRQPYPTAWAYEQVCTALNTHRNMAEVRRLGLAAALRLDNGAPWETIRDRAAELAALPAPADRAAILREAADAYDAIIDKSTGKEADPRYWSGVHDVAVGLRAMADAASGPGGVAGETQQDETQADLLPAWEAMYEPGNVSDYLIGYANDEVGARGAAEAWLRSQAEVTGRLEWVPQTPLDGYDQEAELVERHDDGIDTGPGITIRHRTQKPSA
jgi:hypothetical protein